MLDREIIEIRRIWDETKARHLDYFKFNAKSGRQFIVKQQNIYDEIDIELKEEENQNVIG